MVQERGLAVKREVRREDGETGTRRKGEKRRRGETSRINPADKVAIAYLVIITLLILVFSYRIPWWRELCAGHVTLVALIVLLARVLPFSPSPRLPFSPSRPLPVSPSPRRHVALTLRGWYPVLLIPITYKELSYLIPLIHPHDFDATLAAIDQRLFGVHPTVWLERLTWPPLSEVLQLTYSSYYFLPLVLGVVLWRKGWFEKFDFWVFIVVLGFYVSYLGYIAVPAVGPRFLPSILEAQTIPLTGVWLFQPVREMLDRAEGITRDCFPSGHTELTLLVLYYARKFHRPVFWWLLPLGTGVIVSTVYLRYHYVVDVVAGALVAGAIVMAARPLYGALGGNEARESQ
ncbi:MAG TPA: phosphatase PAP2 family protein [Blastocatellia bacterium]|nr:phosphatase PAP2 family protein [Blastocatellia bacterium]